MPRLVRFGKQFFSSSLRILHVHPDLSDALNVFLRKPDQLLSASEAYALSLAAVEMFYENYAAYGVRNLVNNPEKLASITADLDKRLGL